jgi:hypothetical protein
MRWMAGATARIVTPREKLAIDTHGGRMGLATTTHTHIERSQKQTLSLYTSIRR